jgi:hypothetical protein
MAIIGGSYLKVPAALIPSTLTDFVHKVDLADLTDSFWNNVDAAGAYIRVKNGAGANVPFDLVFIDTGTKKGLLFFKATLTAGAINEFRIAVDDAASAPAATDPLGRNAVWSDYDCFFVGSAPSVNRTGAATTQANLTAGTAHAFSWERLSPNVNVHQGVAYDGTYFYLIDTNAIFKYDKDWNLIASNTNPLAAVKTATGVSVLNHLGDGTIKDGELFIVIEEYPATPYDSQFIVVFNVADLTYNRHYDISAQAHEVSSICWEPVNGYFVVTDFTAAGNTVLHKYSATGSYLGTITTGSMTSKQAIEYYDNKLYLVGSSRLLASVNLDGSGLTTLTGLAPTSQQEGMCSLGDGSFAVLFDGSPSALWRAMPNSMMAAQYPTALNTLSTAPFRCSSLPKRTTWTMGASVIGMSNGSNLAILSYSDNSATAGNRATVALRSGGQTFGAWNSTDSWLNDSNLTNEINYVGQRHRVHHTFDGTTNRKLWKNGRLESTDAGTSQRPAGTGDTLFVGVEDSSPDERFLGLLDFIYLRNGELSADWLLTEYRSWQLGIMYGVSDTAQADADFAELNATIGTDTDPGVGATTWTKTGDVADMTSSARGNGIAGPAYGSRFFRAGASGFARVTQAPVSVSSHASRIDNGDVFVKLTVSIVKDYLTAVTFDDKGRSALSFYDADGDLIRQVWTIPRSTPSNSWVEHSLVMACPRGTRSIKRTLEFLRFDGNDLNIGMDIESLTLYAPEVGTPPPPTGRRRNVAMMIG